MREHPVFHLLPLLTVCLRLSLPPPSLPDFRYLYRSRGGQTVQGLKEGGRGEGYLLELESNAPDSIDRKGERKVGARSFQIRSSSIQPAGGLTPILPPLNERKREGKRERERGPEGFDSSAGCDTLVLVVRPPSPSSWTELKWEPIYTHRGHPNPFFSFLFPSFHSPTLRPISDRRLNIIIFRGGRQTILPISAK